MGKLSRRKGANFEREIARMFADAMPGSGARRGIQYRDGRDEADVVVPAFWIECKRGKVAPIRSALTQAQEAAPQDKAPVVVWRDDRQPPRVTMALDDFLEIVSAWWINCGERRET